MKAQAKLRLSFLSEEDLVIAYKALMPEAEKPATSRSKATLKMEGSSLVLVVKAQDTVALRAALNTYLRWINSILKVLSLMKSFKN
ncbi:hypothetical protein H5T51_03065 [Candidatus Bathyarchaeota archaeon]|nr:hypothetical protein [Candidatus Bathyarchaeota archaeon]